MSDQQKKNRVPLGTVTKFKGKYGDMWIGNAGMAEIVVYPTKADPNKLIIYFQEKDQKDARPYPQRSQAPQRLERPAYAPPQRQAAPPQEEAPWPEEDINF